ncbi:hypothetical protein A8H40_22665 [Burkholderia multivorans]|uniref:Uncharacterized protein n=1 Tax=Burkholderia multivorans CGD2 TaxID=513052 RepID=B9BM74_9BURK|nr:hypothetical protein A8H40_22665 [Burkholderia multivorans]EEE07734.1 hypothetical protein BURMUCGD2_1943 [Burkholderia multivorans CGD2]EEE14328.1 hypothetical protein BURMUCGD2M_2029 [Burkholderia multivorans CGD2M]EJO57081.1 hypothetical protein BURMUCF1_1584 [Burkholderia multivorans ATCC BAA-247]PRE08720.1 hypothetical protein C6P92_26485 [Burkholderia multivorans]
MRVAVCSARLLPSPVDAFAGRADDMAFLGTLVDGFRFAGAPETAIDRAAVDLDQSPGQVRRTRGW